MLSGAIAECAEAMECDEDDYFDYYESPIFIVLITEETK